MTKFAKVVYVAAVAGALGTPVFAQSTTSGNLNVTTSVSATCQTPSPGGTLNAPFDPALALDSQVVGSPVTVTVTCSGGAQITDVKFDNGQNFDAGALTGRVLKGDETNAACFAYTLEVSDDDGYAPAPLSGGSTQSGSWNWDGETSFDVRAKLTAGATYNSADCDTTATSSSDMPGDDYRDTVQMTVEF